VKILIERLRSRGIGTLIDLHALPGGANKDEHSGTSSGAANFWHNSGYQELGRRCALFVAEQINQSNHLRDGVAGLQLVNEALYGADGLYGWYDTCLAALAPIDPSLPIYISDAWDLQKALNYSKSKGLLQAGTHANPVVVDTHRYYCFDEKDKALKPGQVIEKVNHELGELDNKTGNVFDSGAAQVIVGEWSCVLDEQTWKAAGHSDHPAEIVKAFGQAQNQKWQQKTGGSFFWTLKMEWMDGGEWGFKEQVKLGHLTAPKHALLPKARVQENAEAASRSFSDRQESTFSSHSNYWTENAKGKHMEHWRFKEGFKVGWEDAAAFFSSRVSGILTVEKGGNMGEGADRIGLLDLWIRKRILESGMAGPSVWEFEQGLRQGIKGFEEVVGIAV
jgi:hypothetical protein